MIWKISFILVVGISFQLVQVFASGQQRIGAGLCNTVLVDDNKCPGSQQSYCGSQTWTSARFNAYCWQNGLDELDTFAMVDQDGDCSEYIDPATMQNCTDQIEPAKKDSPNTCTAVPCTPGSTEP